MSRSADGVAMDLTLASALTFQLFPIALTWVQAVVHHIPCALFRNQHLTARGLCCSALRVTHDRP